MSSRRESTPSRKNSEDDIGQSDTLDPRETAELLKKLANLFDGVITKDRKAYNSLRLISAKLRATREDNLEAAFERKHRGPRKGGRPPSWLDSTQVKQMTSQEIYAFLSDPGRTKEEMMELARVRFGMPQSRLARIPKAEVADSIRSVLRNEEAISLISEQASKTDRED